MSDKKNTGTKKAVVTGATSGIGEEIVRQLVQNQMTVVMVGRSQQRLHEAAERIYAVFPEADLRFEIADLSLLDEVRELAERIGNTSLPPDVVISCAATITNPWETTSEGIPYLLTVNHLAPYLLMRLLAKDLGNRNARFIVVGADPKGLARLPVDLDNFGLPHKQRFGFVPSFKPFIAYGYTKNMNAMFVYSLARRIEQTNITVNGVHPGIIRGTGLGRNARGALKLFDIVVSNLIAKDPDEGADTPVWLALSPEVGGVTGRFFVERKQVLTASHTTDVERCNRLWNKSARLVGLPKEI